MPTPEIEAFARRVRGHGQGGPRRVLVVGDPEAASWLAGEGFEVELAAAAELADREPHSLDGLWYGAPPPTEELGGAFRVLHHGLVRVPPTGDRADDLALELALERADFQIVERLGGLIGWTKLVTPKIGSGAAIFDEAGRILLANRVDGRGWCLPGGYSDPDEAPQVTVVREVREEVGLEVEVEALLGLYGVTQRVGPKLLVCEFLCHVVGGTLQTTDETIGVGWFAEDELPSPLFGTHPNRIRDAFAARRGEAQPPFIRDTVEPA